MTEIERSLHVPAPPDAVWDALADPELLGEWFGGDVDVDLRGGGTLRVAGADGVSRHAVVETVEPGRRLSFTWADDDGRPPSSVEIDLEPVEGGCDVHVREVLLEAPDPGPAPVPFPIGFQAPAHPAGDARALARV